MALSNVLKGYFSSLCWVPLYLNYFVNFRFGYLVNKYIHTSFLVGIPTLSLKANLLHTWAAFENELSASSSSHLSKTITEYCSILLQKFHLLQPQKKVCIHSYVKEKHKNHEIEICQEIGKRKGMHAFVGKMFFTEFRNRSMS